MSHLLLYKPQMLDILSKELLFLLQAALSCLCYLSSCNMKQNTVWWQLEAVFLSSNEVELLVWLQMPC